MVWTTKPIVGTELDIAHPLNQGLAALWLFNENAGTVINDLSGNNNSGTITNMSSPSTSTSGWNPGRLGPSLTFDKIDDYIRVTKNLTLNFTTATISVWINPNTTGIQVVCARAYSFDWNRLIYGIIRDNTTWAGYVANGTGTSGGKCSFGAVTLGQWNHLVFVFINNGDGTTTLKTYTNGVFSNNVLYSGVVGSQPNFGYGYTYDSDIGIGATRNGGYPYGNMIDEVRIWNRELTASEVTTLYLNPYEMFIGGCPTLICTLNLV